MALRGVAQFVDGFHSRVHGRVVADGIFTAGNVVVDGAGDADAGNALIGQRPGAHKGTVAADDHKGIDSQLLAAGQTLGLTFFGLELQAAGSVQNRTAAVDDLRHAADIHLVAFTVDQSIIAALNAHHAVTAGDAGTHDCAYSGVHTGRIAAARQDADGFNLLSHKISLPLNQRLGVLCSVCGSSANRGHGPSRPCVKGVTIPRKVLYHMCGSPIMDKSCKRYGFILLFALLHGPLPEYAAVPCAKWERHWPKGSVGRACAGRNLQI